MIELTQQKIMGWGSLVMEKVLIVLVVIVSAYIIIQIINRLLGKIFDFTKFDRTLEKFVHKSIVMVLWLVTLGILLALLGVDLSAIVASFGVMSFIVGFALRDTLSNFASGVMILVNKPFVVGDEIEVRGVKGRVKTVSMSNTKIVSANNEKITLPNSLVWSNPITNFTAYKNVE